MYPTATGLTCPTGELAAVRQPGVRRAPLSWRLHNLIRHRSRHLPALAVGTLYKAVGGVTIEATLRGRVIKRDGTVIDYGILGRRLFTSAGAGFIVDAFQNLTELETMEFHGIGTGGTAESNGDTALVTELTTQYTTNSTRATGTNAEGASANIYQTVGTNEVDASVAITEHGIFSDADVGQGVLLDRTLFSAINLTSGDSLQTTYELTIAAES